MDLNNLLTESDLAEVKKRALIKLESQLFVHFNNNMQNYVAEVKNLAVQKASGDLYGHLINDISFNKALNKALNSVESRLNTKIHEMLKNGIKVSFGKIE